MMHTHRRFSPVGARPTGRLSLCNLPASQNCLQCPSKESRKLSVARAGLLLQATAADDDRGRSLQQVQQADSSRATPAWDLKAWRVLTAAAARLTRAERGKAGAAAAAFELRLETGAVEAETRALRKKGRLEEMSEGQRRLRELKKRTGAAEEAERRAQEELTDAFSAMVAAEKSFSAAAATAAVLENAKRRRRSSRHHPNHNSNSSSSSSHGGGGGGAGAAVHKAPEYRREAAPGGVDDAELLRRDLEGMRARLELLEAEAVHREHHLLQLREEKGDVEGRYNAATSELESLNSRYLADTGALDQAEEELGSLRALVDQVREEERERQERSRAEAEGLRAQMEDLRRELWAAETAGSDAEGEVLELRKALREARSQEAHGATAAAMREQKRTKELMETLTAMAALEAELEALADTAAHEAELEEAALPSSSLMSPPEEDNNNENGNDKNGKTPRPPSPPPPGGPPSSPSSSSSVPRGSSSSSSTRPCLRPSLLEASELQEVPEPRSPATMALGSLRLLLAAFLGAVIIPPLAPGLDPARTAFLDALLQHFRSSATSVLMPVGVLVSAASEGPSSSRWEWLTRWYRWSHGSGSGGAPAAYFAEHGLSDTAGLWEGWTAAWNDSGGSFLALCLAVAVAALALAGTWAAVSMLKSLVLPTRPDGQMDPLLPSP